MEGYYLPDVKVLHAGIVTCEEHASHSRWSPRRSVHRGLRIRRRCRAEAVHLDDEESMKKELKPHPPPY
jgi:hypothetical protein